MSNTQTSAPDPPGLRVRKANGEKSLWILIGAAWANQCECRM